MKFKIILFFMVILCNNFINAQTKVGTINSELVISKMPQMKMVLQRIKKFGKQLDSTFQIKTKDYKEKVNAYKDLEQTLTDEVKKTKYQEILLVEQDIQNFKSNAAKLMQIRRGEYMRPLYKKLNETIAEIAKANEYTQILTTNGNQFEYIDERFDITKLVLDKLGIKD